ncbi:putative aminodeoxychorismate lyase [Rodentibacter pneumotropicus]|uniref:Putative aminodeoxychorismate lyase n=1 Tax=Rodentibacter pneumotropicus TaxID=758 RepID=A0A3S4VBR7_9PAST|nr:putative aminodeoxychorismate lyase [Rodentibacter pneumotropicus]
MVDNAQLLPYLLKLKPELNKIKAGVYSLNGIQTVQELLTLLNSGKEVQFSVQFIEGKTFKEWRKSLENAPHLTQTLKDKSDKEIFNLLGIPNTVKIFMNTKILMAGYTLILIITHLIQRI